METYRLMIFKVSPNEIVPRLSYFLFANSDQEAVKTAVDRLSLIVPPGELKYVPDITVKTAEDLFK